MKLKTSHKQNTMETQTKQTMKKLEHVVESVKDFYHNSSITPALVCVGFYGAFVANGFYRGFNNMPIAPETLNQFTAGDVTAAVTGGALELAAIVDGLKTDRYFDGARSAAGIVGLPILAVLTHAVGYALGRGVQQIS